MKYQAPFPRPNRADGSALPALLAVLLLGMMTLQFMLPPEEDNILLPGRTLAPQPTADGASLAIADPIILRDPLFAPVGTVLSGDAAGTGPLGGASFVGVVRGRGFARAVLQRPDGDAVSVSVGGSWRGWKLISLGNDNAMFLKDGIRHNVTIARGAIDTVSRFQPRLPEEQ